LGAKRDQDSCFLRFVRIGDENRFSVTIAVRSTLVTLNNRFAVCSEFEQRSPYR